jgi:hypothetical protein
MSEQPSLLVYHVYSMSTGSVLMCCCSCLTTLSVLRLVTINEYGADGGMKWMEETEILRENQFLCHFVRHISQSAAVGSHCLTS